MPAPSARSRYLLPLVLQLWVAIGVTAGVSSDPGWWIALVSVVLVSVLLGYAVRNLLRLCRAPVHEAGWRTVVAYAVVGAILTLLGSSTVADSLAWDDRLRGLLLLLPFGLALLALAVRDARRTAVRPHPAHRRGGKPA